MKLLWDYYGIILDMGYVNVPIIDMALYIQATHDYMVVLYYEYMDGYDFRPRYQKHDKIYAIKNASVDTLLRWSTKWQGIRTDAATDLSNAAENTTNNKLNQNALRP